jgi:hypothetical protein
VKTKDKKINIEIKRVEEGGEEERRKKTNL